jgi:acetyl esterase/lipase
MTMHRPEIDAELNARLADMPLVDELNTTVLAQLRQYNSPAETMLAGHAVARRDVMIAATDGTELPLSVIRPLSGDTDQAAPCIFWVHPGGMVMGDRFANIDIALDWLDRFKAVVVTLDYRLAPEVNGTTLVEDCYAGLMWVVEHAADLGIDPERIVVAGASAGGGLAAGVVLLARDRGSVSLAAQVLICPMLDHRNSTVSSQQYSGGKGVWTREMNAFGWQAVLGGAGEGAVSPYVSPALEEDLSGLPTTYIDAGSAEVFRDEDVAYASRIWAAGGQAELHVWAGGFHGFDALFPDVRISKAARSARTEWLDRVLNPAA